MFRRVLLLSAGVVLGTSGVAFGQYATTTTTTAPPTTATTAPPSNLIVDDTNDGSDTVYEPGDIVQVTAPNGSFDPNAPYTGVFLSRAVTVSQGTTNAAGGVSFSFTVPNVSPGAHTIEVRSTLNGAPRVLSQAVTVVGDEPGGVAGETLAATGAGGIGDTLRVAGLVGIVGTALVALAVSRRRKPAPITTDA